MKRAVALALAVAILVGFIAFAYTMNPADVDVRISRSLSYRMPLGILLVATLATGVVLAVVAVAVQQLGHTLATWGQRRRARQETLVEELNASGVALAWGGETERSRSVLKKAWRRDPHNKKAALGLAASYSDTGEYGAAQQTLQAAVDRDPADPDLRFALAEALRRNGETEAAIRMHETIRVQFPHAPRVLVALRELYTQTSRWRDAVEVQDRYIAELASAEGVHGERARLRDLRYHAAMELTDAQARIEALNAILNEDRDYAPAIASVGDALLELGRTAEAVKVWEKSFKREPRADLARKLLGQQSDNSGRRHVVSLIDRAADRLDPDDVHVLRASAALQSDALEAAQRELELVTNATRPAVQQCWADLHLKRGDTERAWQTLRPITS
jgi:tetratricopeptide (TPR) repeat protein